MSRNLPRPDSREEAKKVTLARGFHGTGAELPEPEARSAGRCAASRRVAALVGGALAMLLSPAVFGLGQERYVEFAAPPGAADFPLVTPGAAAPVYVDSGEDWGVVRAAGDLQTDIARVTGRTPALVHAAGELGADAVLIGTIGKSPLIDQLIRTGRLAAAPVVGQWESFVTQVVADPLPGVARALVIAGSDRRGTIYGIYDLSEQIGVSPWVWWADVPVARHAALYVKAGRFVQGPPAVKYRGIFLNDEAPSLAGWAQKKFGGFNHRFYEHIFELLLRLKANYLWPAMWDNCFSEDDPLNPKLANAYGIVMGTSHVEPMMRADKEWSRAGYTAAEWNYATHPALLNAFWREGIERGKDYENLITIGMRGKVDSPMAPGGNMAANVALLEKIVADQRAIIGEVMHTDPARVPQVWAIYKEVQDYYDYGMRVPDDVTLLWCDDNFGNIRRLPTAEERGRSGGAGIYYHFDYVGAPRSYKWVDTVPLTKIWEQMHLAHRYGANRIWIVNVGSLKLKEFPIEFFLTYAWDPSRWPQGRLADYGRLWAAREFGPEHAAEIASLVARYTKYNGRRKPGELAPDTYSFLNYREAHRVAAEWRALVNEAERIGGELPPAARDAFFELVLYPVKGSAQVAELYLMAGRNALYARQGRAGTNDLAARARALFQADADLSAEYNHALAHGKWDGMMAQTHIGFTSWRDPPVNRMPPVVELKLPVAAAMGIAVEGSASAWPGAPGAPALPTFDAFNRQRAFVDVFNRGQTPFAFQASASAPWIVPDATEGTVGKEWRVWISLDWAKVPPGLARGTVTFTGASGERVAVGVTADNPPRPAPLGLGGFVESGGYVSMEAAHYTRKLDAGPVRWEEIPDYGRTLSAMTVFPVTAPSVIPPRDSPCLEYRMYVFHPGTVQVAAYIAPTLDFVPGRGLRFAVSFDGQPPQLVDVIAHPSGPVWTASVKDNIRILTTTHTLKAAGWHTLKFWMVDPAVVLEKLVVNLGGLKPSYLGPPESARLEPVSSPAPSADKIIDTADE